MSWESLKSAVAAVIKTNGNNEITGQVLQDIINNNIIPQLGGDKYKGEAIPTSAPGTPESEVFYYAKQEGTYSNFGGAVLPKGLHLLYFQGGVWENYALFKTDPSPSEGSSNLLESGAVYDSLQLKADLEVGKNKFNFNTLTPDFYITETGSVVPNGTLNHSDYISIDALGSYVSNYDIRFTCFFDLNKNVVAGGSGSLINAGTPFSTPIGSVFVIISFYDFDHSLLQLEEGTVITDFETYKEAVLESQIPADYIKQLSDESILESTYITNLVASTKQQLTINSFNINRFAPNLVHLDYIDYIYPRKELSVLIFTGITRYVSTTGNDANDGLTLGTTKKTITSAYNSASEGDIVQMLDGVYDLSTEAGGYLLLNTTSKGVLIQGNALDNEAVILSQGSASFAMRFRDCGECKIKDVKLDFSGTGDKLYLDYGASFNNRTQIFENCKIVSVGNNKMFTYANGANVSDIINVNFNGCDFDSANTDLTLNLPLSANTFNLLFNSCNIERSNEKAFEIDSSSRANLYVYDCNFDIQGDYMAIKIGTDTATPTVDSGFLDVRNSNVIYGSGFKQHGLLIGRGIKNAYVFNNLITMGSTTDTNAIGIVAKSTPSTIGDVLIYGNYCNAPRPFYIKGGSNNDVKYNSFISNNDIFGGIDFVNFLDGGTDILSSNNLIKFNNIISLKDSIKVYIAGTAEESDVTIQNNTFEDNKYYLTINYLTNGATAYPWSDRQNFWDTDKDVNSALLQDFHIPVRKL
jgi:hypothetical protein